MSTATDLFIHEQSFLLQEEDGDFLLGNNVIHIAMEKWRYKQQIRIECRVKNGKVIKV